MIVPNAETHVLGSHGLSETKQFSIRTNAHAFKMLSSGLYSDKIAAVIREIGCNAVDAHIAMGTPDLPITVKLPNRIDNQFYIRDMGPGLSHEEVMELYTTYFASTKQTSNDFTGAFGLGSKSPFSYTDQFTVTSVYGKVKRTYSAYIDNTGSPTIAKLTEVPADPDWQHGVQISFPVRPEDFAAFEERAQRIYRWFRIKPTILGSKPILPIKVVFENEDFMILSSANVALNGFGVLMGGVYYPLQLANLGIGTYMRSVLHQYAIILPNLTLKLKIGDVQVAGSREELQYDDASKKILRGKIEEVLKYIGNELATKLRQMKTWDEKTKAKETSKIWIKETYRSTLAEFFKLLGYQDYSNLAGLMTSEYVDCPKTAGVKTECRKIDLGYRRRPSSEKIIEGRYKGASTSRAHLYLSKKTIIVYGRKNLSFTKVTELLLNGTVEQVLLFTPGESGDLAEAKAEAKTVADELGLSDVRDVDTIPLPTNYVKTVRKVKKKSVLAPLPSQMVTTKHIKSSAFTKQDIVKIDATKTNVWKNFMVRSPHTGLGRSDQIRVFEKSAGEDRMIPESDWNTIWDNVGVIADNIGGPIEGYIELSAVDVRKLDLVKRGYRPTYNILHEWLSDPKTHDKIVNAAKQWRPSMDLSMGAYHQYGWAGELVWIAHNYPKEYLQIMNHLQSVNLHNSVDDILVESRKGKNKGSKEPVVVSAYRNLAKAFNNLTPITTTATGNFVSIEDFNQSITTRFPLTNVFPHHNLREMASNHPSKLLEFVKIVIS